MKLEEIQDLPTINEPTVTEEALIARLAYAKELLDTEKDARSVDEWHKDRLAFIEKLNSEGL